MLVLALLLLQLSSGRHRPTAERMTKLLLTSAFIQLSIAKLTHPPVPPYHSNLHLHPKLSPIACAAAAAAAVDRMPCTIRIFTRLVAC
jgi:hypothetical protein